MILPTGVMEPARADHFSVVQGGQRHDSLAGKGGRDGHARTVMAMSTVRLGNGAEPAFGELLKYWRGIRHKSQLELSSDAQTTPRYVSFVETGRSQPSREMILRLARALDVPLRDRNGLLLAAGYAPVYPVEVLGAPQLEAVDTAVSTMLDQHNPFPAVVMDRTWNVLRANDGAAELFGRLLAPRAMPEPANVLRLMIEPGPVQRSVLNWAEVVPTLLERARREAVGGVLDRVTADLVAELRALPNVVSLLANPDATPPTGPVVDVQFQVDEVTVSFFSMVSTIGTPIDVNAQELRVEAFFPADEHTRLTWRELRRPLRIPRRQP
jgi:transcriptional regulator with XRE-family HTH domain